MLPNNEVLKNGQYVNKDDDAPDHSERDSNGKVCLVSVMLVSAL